MNWNHTWQKCSWQGPYQVLLFFVPIGHPTWLPGAIKASDWSKFQSYRESLKQMGPNLTGMFLCMFCPSGVTFVPISHPTWLPGDIIASDWLNFFKDLQYYRRMELNIVMNDHCKLLTKCSYFFGYIYLYSILWSWYTSRPLGMPPYSICKWYCIHVRVVVLGYIIHYRCRTTCMISTILQYGKEMADINANNIFHKKATVEACQPSRPNSCWIGPMMVIFSVEYGQMAQVSKPIRLLLQIKISKKKATNEPRWAITGSWEPLVLIYKDVR